MVASIVAAMALPPSGSQIDKSSVRLRESVAVAEADLAQLQQLLLAYSDVRDRVAGQLRAIGLAPTTRLKSSGTIIDKPRRERHRSRSDRFGTLPAPGS